MRLRHLPQSHAFPIVYSAKKFDPRFHQRGFNCLNSAEARVNLSLFQPSEGIKRHDRAIGQLLLGPSQEGACRADLSRRDHAGDEAEIRRILLQ